MLGGHYSTRHDVARLAPVPETPICCPVPITAELRGGRSTVLALLRLQSR